MSLQQIFFESLSNNKLNVEYSKYLNILRKDINIDVIELDPLTLKLLSKVMIFYMKGWPDWAELKKNPKELNSGLAFIRFRKYLKQNILFVLKHKEKLWKMVKEKDVKSVHTQVYIKDSITTLPYCIQIKGTANYINSLFFIEQNNGIVAKQHPIIEWDLENFTLQKFINFPYVSVNLTLPDICLSRNNTTEIERCLRLNADKVPLPNKEFIWYTNKIDSSAPVNVYTYYFFKKYVQQFESIVSETDMITKFRKKEVLTILEEFLKDVDECDLYGKTMATNTAVCFNIGKCRYIRTKKRKIDPVVLNQKNLHYYEYLTPRVLLTLKHFDAEQDMRATGPAAEEVTFIQLNPPFNVKELAAAINKDDCISYSCTLCNKVFSTYANIKAHFQTFHKGECDVACPKCYNKFALHALAESRWCHRCVQT